MKNGTTQKRVKEWFKQFIYASPALRGLFIFIYKVFGCRPWSLGYSVYKFSQIRHVLQDHLEIFSRESLPPQYGARLDERIVEYPWFFSRLGANEKIILDAGATLNHADILSLNLLKDRTLYISTLFYEGFPRTVKVPRYVFEDIRKMCYKDETFDAVACLSTLEHVGMDNSFIYTPDKRKKEDDAQAYITGVCELKRVLKNNGALYLTMPYGRYKNHKWFQIFDAEMVGKVKKAFSPVKASETYFKYENGQWNYSDAQSCRDGYYFDIHSEKKHHPEYLAASQSVVCLELVK